MKEGIERRNRKNKERRNIQNKKMSNSASLSKKLIGEKVRGMVINSKRETEDEIARRVVKPVKSEHMENYILFLRRRTRRHSEMMNHMPDLGPV